MTQVMLNGSKSPKRKKKTNLVKVHGGSETMVISVTKNSRPQPVRINPESEEDRAQRLAKRKAATLKAFQTTYQQRKKSSGA